MRRAWSAAIAALVLAGLIVQLWVAVDVSATPPGHAVGTLAGTYLAGRVVRVLSFFTVQANVLSALSSARLLRDPACRGQAVRAVRLAALLGITVTGIVYSTVLAGIHEPHGWRETFTNDVFHYAVPILMVAGWVLFGPRPRVDARTVALAMIWPAAWVVYTLARGAATSWYPYPFLDVVTHGYLRVALNVVAVLAVALLVLGVFAFGDRKLPPTRDG